MVRSFETHPESGISFVCQGPVPGACSFDAGLKTAWGSPVSPALRPALNYSRIWGKPDSSPHALLNRNLTLDEQSHWSPDFSQMRGSGVAHLLWRPQRIQTRLRGPGNKYCSIISDKDGMHKPS